MGSFDDLLRAVAEANAKHPSQERLPSQMAPGEVSPTGGIKDKASEVGTRKAEGLDLIFGKAAELGRDIGNIAGFDGRLDSADDILPFLASLPTGIISALPSGAAQAYEAVIGTPVQEIDTETNLIPDYQLTPEQRMGSGIEGGINLIGGAFGGTGRVVGTVAKGITGGKIGKSLAEGTIKGLKQIPADMAEEAGEEFVQSLASQTRYDEDWNYGDAAYAAGLGALGGGIMSGAMYGVNKVLDSESAKTRVQPHSIDSPSYSIATEDPDYAATLSITNPVVAEAALARQEQKTERAAGTFKGANVSSDVGVDETELGVRPVLEMWNIENRDEEAAADPDLKPYDKGRRQIVERLKVGQETTEEAYDNLDKIFKTNDLSYITNELNSRLAQIEAAGGGLTIAVGRNPDSEPNAVFLVRVKRFVNGAGIGLNAVVPVTIGADQDGDTWQAFFDRDRINNVGYITRKLVDHVTGKAASGEFNVDLGLSRPNGMDPTYWVKSLYAPIEAIMGSEYKNTFVRDFQSVFTGDGVADNEQLAIILSKLRHDIAEKNKSRVLQSLGKLNKKAPLSVVDAYNKDKAERMARAEDEADFAISDMLINSRARTVDDTAIYEKLHERFEKRFLVEYGEPLESVTKKIAESSGRVDDNYIHALIHYILDVGGNPSPDDNAGNPTYREMTKLYFEAKSTPFGTDEETVIRKVGDVFAYLFARAFRMADLAVEPSEAIEGMVNDIIRTQVIAFSGLNQMKVGRGIEVDDLLDNLVMISNKMSSLYNEARSTPGFKGPIKSLTSNKPEVKRENEPEVYRLFINVFGETRLKDIFYMEELGSLGEQRLVDHLEDVSKQSIRVKDFINFLDDGKGRDLYRKLIDNYMSVKKAQNESILKIIENIPIISEDAIFINDKGHYAPRPEYIRELASRSAAIANIIGGDRALDAGYGDLGMLLSRQRGRTILTSNKRDVITNAVFCDIIEQEFAGVIAALNGYDTTKDPVQLEIAKDLLIQMSGKGVFYKSVVDYILEHGMDPAMLRFFISDDISWQDKLKGWDTLMENKRIEKFPPLFISAVLTSDDAIAMSGLAIRLRKAKSQIEESIESSAIHARDMVKVVRKNIENTIYSPKEVRESLIYLASEASITYNDMIKAASFYEARMPHTDEKDKATTPSASSMDAQQNAMVNNGGTIAWLNAAQKRGTGVFTQEDIARNPAPLLMVMAGKGTYSFTQDGAISSSSAVLDQKAFFERILGREITTAEPTVNDWLDVLDAAPALVGYMCNRSVVPVETSEGPGVQLKRVGTLHDALEKRVQGMRQGRQDEQVEYAKMKIRDMIFNDPKFSFAWNLFFENKPADADPEIFYSRASKEIERWINAFFVKSIERAQDPKGSAIEAKINREKDIYKLFGQVLHNHKYISDNLDGSKNYLKEEILNMYQVNSDALITTEVVSALGIKATTPGTAMPSVSMEAVFKNLSKLKKMLLFQLSFAADNISMEVEDSLNLRPSEKNRLMLENMINEKDSNGDFVHPPEARLAAKKALDHTLLTKDILTANTIQDAIRISDHDRVSGKSKKATKKRNDNLKRKIKSILETSASISDLEDLRNLEQFDDDYFARVTSTDARWEAFKLHFNNKLMKSILKEATVGGPFVTNFNLERDITKANDWIESTIGKIVQAMNNGDIVVSDVTLKDRSDLASASFPPITYAQAADNAAYANRAQVLSEGAPVGAATGIDGSMFQLLGGLSYLTNLDAPPIAPITRDEAIQLYRSNDLPIGTPYRYAAQGGEVGNLHYISQRTIDMWTSDDNAGYPELDVYIYRPDDCLQQPCREFCPASYNPNVNPEQPTVLSITLRLLGFAQEELILRRKKQPGGEDTIVDVLFYTPDNGPRTIKATTPDAVMAELVKYRKQLARHLQGVFDRTMKVDKETGEIKDKLGFQSPTNAPGSQARILSQFLTPAVRLNYKDTVLAGSKSLDISITQLMSPTFSIDWANVESVTLDVKSLQTISAKLLRTSSRIRDSIGKITREYLVPIRDSITDWTDFNTEEFDLKQLIGRVSALAESPFDNIAVSGSPTALINMIDQIKSETDSVFVKRGKLVSPEMRTLSVQLKEALGDGNTKFPYYPLYADNDKPSAYSSSVENIIDFQNVITAGMPSLDSNVTHNMPGVNCCALLYTDSQEKVERMAKLAMEKQVRLVVNANAPFSDSAKFGKKSLAWKNKETVFIQGKMFYALDYKSSYVSQAFDSGATPVSFHRVPNDAPPMLAVAVDRQLMGQTEGAVAFNPDKSVKITSSYLHHFETKLRDLFTEKRGGSYSIISKAELIELTSHARQNGLSAEDIFAFTDAGYKTSEFSRESAVASANNLLNKKNFDDFDDRGLYIGDNNRQVSRGDCIGIAKHVNKGEITYSPIILHFKAMPKIKANLHYTDFENGTLGYDLHLIADMDEVEAWKGAIAGSFYKGSGGRRPLIGGGFAKVPGKNAPVIYAVVDSQSTEKKIAGFESINFLETLIAVSDQPTVGRNLFYHRSDSDINRWEPNDWFGRLTEKDQLGLTSGIVETDIVVRMAKSDGAALTGDADLDKILGILARMAIQHRIPFSHLVTNVYVNPDGTGERFRLKGTFASLYSLHLTDAQLLVLFNAMNNKLVPRNIPNARQEDWDGKTILDYKGRIWVELKPQTRGSRVELYPCKVMASGIESLNDNTAFRHPSGKSSFSMQHRIIRSFESGLVNTDFREILDYGMMKLGDFRGYMHDKRYYADKRINKDSADYIDVETYEPEVITFDSPISSPALYKHLKKVSDVGKTFEKMYIVKDEEDNIITPSLRRDDPENLADIELGRLNAAFQLKEPIKWLELLNIHYCDIGHTFLDGRGDNTLYISYIRNTVDELIKNVNNPSVRYYLKAKQTGDRYTIPLLPQHINCRLAESPVVQAKFGTDEDVYEGMLQGTLIELQAAHRNLAYITNDRKKQALGDMIEYLEMNNELPVSENWVASKDSFHVLLGRSNSFIDRFFPAQADAMKQYNEHYLREVAKANSREEMDKTRRYSEVEVQNSQHGSIAKRDAKADSPIVTVGRWLTSFSKIMALMSPFVPLANVSYKGMRQSVTELILRTGAIGGKYDTPYDILHAIDADPTMNKIYTTMRVAMIDGEEFNLMRKLNTNEDIDNYINGRNKNKNVAEKVEESLYGLATGGNVFQKQSIRNFWDLFLRRAYNEGYGELFVPIDNSGEPLVQVKLRENPAKLFIEIFSPNSSCRTLAMQCLQEARTGDLAQDNIGSEVIKYITRDRPFWKFIQTTGVVRFPQYSFNILGAMAQFISPMSSINYLATKYLQKKQQEGVDAINSGKKGKDLDAVTRFAVDIDADRLQMRASLQEAMQVDAMWMGSTALIAILLQAIPGLLEPPDDEDKWCNADEWTVFGFRVGEEWWMQDIMGMSLHAAIAFKAAMKGKPQPHILIDGITRASYSNPMLRLADMVNFLATDPADQLLDDFNQEVDDYKNATGGSPGILDTVTANLTTFGISYMTQFILPSLIKEIYQDAQPYEASYKRVYEENNGQLTEAGAAGKTVKTDYFNAQLRKLAKNNPAAAIFLDMFNNSETPYWAFEQPHVTYSDPTQMDSVIKYSIRNEDNTEKTDEEKQAVFGEVFCKLISTNDMEALYKSGFMINAETRYYVGQQLWDLYQDEIDRWNDFVKETGLDANVLGDGDWAAGMKKKTELYEEHMNVLNYYKSIYYDRLYSQPMKRGVAKYYMYNTTFAVDANGEAYATGLKPTVFPSPLPFMFAPGTLSDPEGTMGYEGDWATPSSLDENVSTGIRALVPIPFQYDETPSFESMAGDGNGNGKSTASTDYSNKSGSGYGYSRSGGGSSYVQDIYSRPANVYAPSPKISYTDRPQRSNLDYLRPSVETKGSREAYKREDF